MNEKLTIREGIALRILCVIARILLRNELDPTIKKDLESIESRLYVSTI